MRWFRLAADQGYWNGGKVLQLVIAEEFIINLYWFEFAGKVILAVNIIM
jgi:hypothetical protein